MKKLLRVCVTLVMAMTTLTALAADVTGTWSGDMKTPDGNGFHISFTLKQDGANLTGTVQGAQGDPLPISEGKVDGDKISFKVVFNGTTFTHTGTITGDQIKLTTQSSQGDIPGSEMTLTRAK